MQSLVRHATSAAAGRAVQHLPQGRTLTSPSSRRSCSSARVRDAKEGKQQSVEDVLAAANALLDNLAAGGDAPSQEGYVAELESLGYVCDESGCVLVLPGSQDSVDGGSPLPGLLSGSNWSLGMLDELPEPEEGEEQTPYTAIIAGSSWSVPLKESELAAVLAMLMQLRMMVADMNAQGQWLGAAGDRPASRVKRQTSHIEIKAEHATASPGFSVEFTFRSSSRYVTTAWPADITAAVIVAVDKAMGKTSPDSTGRLERVSATPATAMSA